MKTPRLGVNVDHVATLRQARGTRYPDPILAASMAELAGADQITVHLREDRRHIQSRDVRLLRQTIQTSLNLEMAVTDEMCDIAMSVNPEMVTLVPERREERTTEGGLDVTKGKKNGLKPFIKALQAVGIIVSLFIDPNSDQVSASKAMGAESIELHTGDYCSATDPRTREKELRRLEEAARHARDLGLIVAAGHGLDYKNVVDVAALRLFEEFNIGHSIIARAVFVGMDRAVREMSEAISLGHNGSR
jgi:pyridoxine 5-phosphate synthase